MSEETNPGQNEAMQEQSPETIYHGVPLSDQENLTEKEKPSYKWIILLNIVLFIGLVVLYYLFFSEKGKGGSTDMSKTLIKAGSGSMSVAFVNNDSILANYELVKKLKQDLNAKGDRLTAEVAAKQKSFEKDAAYFQEQVQKKSISEESAQEIYASLMETQQKIYDLRDQYAAELQKEEADMNVALLDSVMNFLKRYNEKYRFDYILGFNKGGNILYANDTLDITNDVLRELNKEYKAKGK